MQTVDTPFHMMHLPCRYYKMYPPGRSDYAYEDIHLPVAELALVIVDVYGKSYGSLEETASLDEPEWSKAQDLIYRDVVRDYVVPAREAADLAKLPIVYLTNFLSPATTEESAFRNLNLRTYGFDILEAWRSPSDALDYAACVKPRETDYHIPKQHYSGFFQTALDSLLRDLGVRTLVIVGVDSRLCVGATAMDGLFRGYRIVVLRDCVKSYEFPETEEGQWANFIAVREIESVVGYTSTRDEWCRACSLARPQ